MFVCHNNSPRFLSSLRFQLQVRQMNLGLLAFAALIVSLYQPNSAHSSKVLISFGMGEINIFKIQERPAPCGLKNQNILPCILQVKCSQLGNMKK